MIPQTAPAAESLFPLREIVENWMYLPPRIDQYMFIGKTKKLRYVTVRP